ncbi:TRAP-type C4-dicarboxylate transport system permease small subunit [Mesocricetibacter intestinalis]|uniref:TRAP transporter small permease protein n=1 Tax=Mesocricetibacter intestinalis TaxID=1521930 RepID=A0A4R6VCW2_9PAST|nr:TRAP transporter small permease [Mesocricetibacter intestinalis]TDQ58085.1 TRAP-type C4-dicarboxylate transport system permease small subunit [Mesocricetibacter intestinalis]
MKLLNVLDKTLKLLSILALISMIALVFFNAVLRYFFDSGIAWSEEFARICFVYMIFFGIILVARDKGHLTVDILISNVPDKTKRILTILSDLLILIAMSFVSYGAFLLIELTYSQQMPATGISASFLYIAAIISSVTYFIMTAFDIYKNIKSTGE